MRIDVAITDDKALKARALELLAYGVIPFEQWVNVFANPSFAPWPNLRVKTFSVWFPTMIDYLQGTQEVLTIKKELERRRVDTVDLFSLHLDLTTNFRGLLALFSIEEQLFIRDRRLQNVHGRLQLSTYEEHDVPLYDKGSQEIRRYKFTAEEYRARLLPFYRNLSAVTTELLNRLLSSGEFTRMSQLYDSKLKIGKNFHSLIAELGVSSECGSE